MATAQVFSSDVGFRQAPPGIQQHPVIIQPSVTPTVSSSSQMHQALGVKTTKCLSILLVICGVLMIIIQIACTVIVEENPGHWGAHYGGSGIWCGFFIMLSGIIGCCAASKKSNGLVITFLVFNILCVLLFCPVMFGVTGSDLADRSWHFCGYNYRDHKRNCSFYDVLVALTVTLLLDALLVFGISIWAIATNSSAIKKSRGCACCCQCCIESPSQTQSPIVIYLPANQAPGHGGQPSHLYTFPNQEVSSTIPPFTNTQPNTPAFVVAPGTLANPPPYKA